MTHLAPGGFHFPFAFRCSTHTDLTYSVSFIAFSAANSSMRAATYSGSPTIRRGLCFPPVGFFGLLMETIVTPTANRCKQLLHLADTNGFYSVPVENIWQRCGCQWNPQGVPSR